MDNDESHVGSHRNYRYYEMSEKEMILGWSIGFLGAAIVFFTLCIKLIIAIPICIIFGFYGIKTFREYLMKKQKKILLTQFVSLIDGLNNSYKSGCNTLEAFALSREEMVYQYGESSLIVIEIELVLTAFENNIPLEVALGDFSKRSDLEDIESFVDAFYICSRYGGDFSDVLNEVDGIIKNKVETDMEIATTISDKKMELNIMMLMPLLIVLALRGSGVFAEQTLTNAIVKIIALGLFVLAYQIGKGIINIKV